MYILMVVVDLETLSNWHLRSISKLPLWHLILLVTIRHYWPLFVTFVTFSILAIKKSTRLGIPCYWVTLVTYHVQRLLPNTGSNGGGNAKSTWTISCFLRHASCSLSLACLAAPTQLAQSSIHPLCLFLVLCYLTHALDIHSLTHFSHFELQSPRAITEPFIRILVVTVTCNL